MDIPVIDIIIIGHFEKREKIRKKKNKRISDARWVAHDLLLGWEHSRRE